MKKFEVILQLFDPDSMSYVRVIRSKDLAHAWKLARRKFCYAMLSPVILDIQEV